MFELVSSKYKRDYFSVEKSDKDAYGKAGEYAAVLLPMESDGVGYKKRVGEMVSPEIEIMGEE